MLKIRPSSLTAFNTCPYKYKKGDMPHPKYTWKGDILNAVAINCKRHPVFSEEGYSAGLSPLYKKYFECLGLGVKEQQKFYKAMRNVADHMERVNHVSERTYKEVKLASPYNSDSRLIGSPDLFYYNRVDDEWIIEDFKYSTLSYYGDGKLEKQCQPHCYAHLFMETWTEVHQVKFRFVLLDKKTGKKHFTGERIITRKEAKEFVDEVVERYLMAYQFDEFGCEKSDKCWSCPLRKLGCPEWNRDSISDDDLSELDSLFD